MWKKIPVVENIRSLHMNREDAVVVEK